MTARQRFNYTSKLLLSHVLYHSGLLRLWQRLAMRHRAVVLMYHRVLTREERGRTASHGALVVDADTFDRHMEILKRRFKVLSIEEFADCLQKRVPFPDSSCLVTFDDGWMDTYTNALPVLQRHGLPALIFLPVNYIGRRRVFWQEALTHLLRAAAAAARRDSSRRAAFEALLAPSGLQDVIDASDGTLARAIEHAVGRQKRRPRGEVEHLLERLAAELNMRVADLAEIDGFLDWEQAAQMSSHGVAFGGHGAEHLLLTEISAQEAEEEIRASKKVLDARIKPAVSTFSYPNGYLTAAVVESVRSAGYGMAFVTRHGLVRCDADPLTIPRHNVHQDGTATEPMFLARILGLW